MIIFSLILVYVFMSFNLTLNILYLVLLLTSADRLVCGDFRKYFAEKTEEHIEKITKSLRLNYEDNVEVELECIYMLIAIIELF